ncbi:FmdB family zinc ribbon protein [Candidatus Poriferisodalis sp.]|uniref:FmdB family zinc ribbon protein n=1 Tax=Candidatus Poriferisodalis sp. TaxID=3101277 RepID=UPI003B02D494
MPTYQYRCTDCGQSFERYQSFSDDPITVCPLPAVSLPRRGDAVHEALANDKTAATCGGEVRKIFSNVGISFKGSGFYRNDSRASSKSSSGSSTSKTAGESSSDSVSDSPSSTSTSSDSVSSASASSSTVEAASASG